MNPLPYPLQKIIIEYCYYPKLYLEELKEKTASIYKFIHLTARTDLGYTYYNIYNFPDKQWGFVCGGRRDLELIKKNSDRILGLGRTRNDYHQLGYYGY